MLQTIFLQIRNTFHKIIRSNSFIETYWSNYKQFQQMREVVSNYRMSDELQVSFVNIHMKALAVMSVDDLRRWPNVEVKKMLREALDGIFLVARFPLHFYGFLRYAVVTEDRSMKLLIMERLQQYNYPGSTLLKEICTLMFNSEGENRSLF